MVRESREMVLAYFKHYQSGVCGVRQLRVSLSGGLQKHSQAAPPSRHLAARACRLVCVSQRAPFAVVPPQWPGPRRNERYRPRASYQQSMQHNQVYFEMSTVRRRGVL